MRQLACSVGIMQPSVHICRVIIMSSATSYVPVATAPPIDLLREAIGYHQDGRLDSAETAYRALLDAQPGHPDALHNLGLLLLGRGEYEAALPCLNSALEAQPQNPRCWMSYAEALLIAGRADEARQVILVGRGAGLDGADVDLLEARITVAWSERPDLAVLRSLMDAKQLDEALIQSGEQIQRFGEDVGLIALRAEILMQLGKNAEALSLLDKACAQAPSLGATWLMRGDVLRRLNRHEAAYSAYLKALALHPDDPEIFALLGENLHEAGFFEEAYLWLRRAALGGVGAWRPWLCLGDIVAKMGAADTAVLSAAMSNELPPTGNEAVCLLRVLELDGNLGRLPRPKHRHAKAPGSDSRNHLKHLLATQQLDQALNEARNLCESFPLDAFGWKVLGAVLKVQENSPEMAQLAMQLGLAATPDDAEGYVNLAALYSDSHRETEAEAAARRALSCRPGLVKAHVALAGALREQGKLVEARDQFRQAVDSAPPSYSGRAFVYNNIGHIDGMLGDSDAALDNYRKVLQLDKEFDVAHSNLLFTLSHRTDQDADSLFAEHCRFGDVFEKPLRPQWPNHPNERIPERCLQVGFVSGDFYGHALANFIEPILAQLATYPGLCLHAYYNNSYEDDVTHRLQGYVKHWHRVGTMLDGDLAKKIMVDRIDILIDLSGHTAKNRLRVFAHKPAPIQASWMGYPGTTGLQAMDYYIADSYFLPPSQFANQFTEKLLCLPASAPFSPFEGAPAVNELPALKAGYLTFGSFNRLDKLSPATFALWAQLLRAQPDARMLVGGLPIDFNHERLFEIFAQEGIGRERLELHPRSTMAAYLALHHRVDICLDAYPYVGGTTTLHALWMGVPTLSIAGLTPACRTGASIAEHAGLHVFVANDSADFVSKGVAWAKKLSELAEIRAGLRQRFDQSAMRQPAVIAAGLERALRIAWRRWCEGLPAESIDVSMNDFPKEEVLL